MSPVFVTARSIMDSVPDSDSGGVGSIPVGRTNSARCFAFLQDTGLFAAIFDVRLSVNSWNEVEKSGSLSTVGVKL